jgi:2-amino-4-hydroxy-6-hydroxymethyldihydropteridine diphosphokinase
MPRSLISLGANLGNTYETMLAASRLLIDIFGRSHVQFSRLYRTPPIGGPTGQSDFLNAVASVDSALSCWEVWEAIKGIEHGLGRQRLSRWEARRMDVDLLLHGDERVWTPHFKVPHPRMCMRTFVLIPANEVAPDLIDPVTGWSIGHLRKHLEDAGRRSTLVVCNSIGLAAELESKWTELELPDTVTHLQFRACDTPANLKALLAPLEPQLVILSVRTPDPETIQWEDYSQTWATALRLTPAEPPPCVEGPRYLLPANDLDWAAHEIQAAWNAMRCPMLASEMEFPLAGE